MEGLYCIAGCGPTVRLGRERLPFKARTIADYGLIEAEILKQCGHPLNSVRAAARVFAGNRARQQAAVRNLLERTCRRKRFVTLGDVAAWLSTWPGACFALWLAVRDNDPSRYTLERVSTLADWDEITRAMRVAAADDERILAECFGLRRLSVDGPIPWPQIYRQLGRSPWCLSADDVGRLTLYQLWIYLSDESEWRPRVEFASAGAMQSWQRDRCAAVTRVANQLISETCP